MNINSLNKNDMLKNDNSEGGGSQLSQKRRTRRVLKQVKKDDSFTSSIDDDSEISSEPINKNKKPNQIYNNSNLDFNEEEGGDEIIMEGNLIYRYNQDQIELEGFWSLAIEGSSKEKFSYLLKNRKNYIPIPIDWSEIDISESNYININNINTTKPFIINLCSGNLPELLLIPKVEIFGKILTYLSGEYHGFFVYLGKTIEDRYNLHFSLENNQVRINGNGNNNLGDFNIIGYANLFTMKDQMINHNDVESDVINFGKIKFTRIYNAFDNNENVRVIKSYQHSRRKNDEDY